MQADTTPLPFRHDTLLGVCEGLGRTLGINANIPRIVFSVLLLWNPVIVVGIYLALGAVLALVHWLVPDVRAVSDAKVADDEARSAPANCERETARAA